MSKWSPKKAEALAMVTRSYRELKGARNEIKARKLREVEDEMAKMKQDFADLVQRIYEEEDLGVPVTVSDLCSAMGTSSRNTVYEYLGDAKERKSNKFFTDILTPAWTFFKPFENDNSVAGDEIALAYIAEGDQQYKVEYHAKWGYLRVWQIGIPGFLNWRPGEFKQNMNGITHVRPEFLTWLEDTKEWKEKGW